MNAHRIILAVLLSAAIGACATTNAPAPESSVKADLKIVPIGSTFTILEENSGSFGSAGAQRTIQVLEDTLWQGRKVMVRGDGSTVTYLDPKGLGMVVRMQNGSPIETIDPPQNWEFPLFVGKAWIATFRYTDHI